MHLSVAIPEGCDPGTYAGMARELFTLVVNFKPGMVGGGLDRFCTRSFRTRSPEKDPRDSAILEGELETLLK